MKDDLVYIQHMAEAIERMQSYTHGMDEYAFLSSEITMSATVREFEIIGEATTRVSEDFRLQHQDLPWRTMVDMRNFLIHDYFMVDPKIVWKAVKEDVPPLEKQIRGLLEKT